MVVGAGRGLAEQRVLMPPPTHCCEWMGELDRLFLRELLLKSQLVERLAHDSPAAHVQQTLYLWKLQPSMCSSTLERLRALASSLSLAGDGDGDAPE